MDELLLRLAESSFVGNIEDTIVSLSVLSVNTSDLDLILISNSVECILVIHKLWQLDVDRGSHGGTKVGWARGNVTEMFVVGEINDSFNMLGSSAKSLENCTDVGTWLHGNDS